MRLITRDDTSLAVGLIVGAIIMFQQPLRFLLDIAHTVEVRYNLDLLPALVTISGVFIFHHYRKRQLARAEAAAAAAAAARARARSEELERLMALGRALASALDVPTVQQALWRHLPAFVGDRSFWILARVDGRWHEVLQDTTCAKEQATETLESVAERAVAAAQQAETSAVGATDGTTLCFPLFAGDDVIGVLGIPDGTVMPPADRTVLGAAAGLIAIALTNVQLFREVRDNSVRDRLTGCFNREHGLATLDGELRRAKRSLAPVSIVMFDVDRFKEINDGFGHLRGDDALRAVGVQLRRVLRRTDVPCRYGGDEFLVVLPDTDLAGAAHVAENLRREISTLALATGGDQAVRITASIGYAAAFVGELDVAALVSRADEALYRAKAEGRNRVCAPGEHGCGWPTDAALAPEAGQTAATMAPLESPTILVADDEPLARELIRKSLEPSGYRVLSAANGAEAIAAAHNYHGSIDLLLTDLVMPDLNGLDLAHRMRSLRPGIRTLFVSGFIVQPSPHATFPIGDGAFLQKPFTLRSLVEAVRRALDPAPMAAGSLSS